jgi:hypothetical protein
MADPLSLLREYTVNKRPFTKDKDDNFVFGKFVIPGSTKTTFKSRRGRGEPYTLEAISFYLSHSTKQHSEYMVRDNCYDKKKSSNAIEKGQCAKLGVKAVSLIDKKDLLAYLEGEHKKNTIVSSF